MRLRGRPSLGRPQILASVLAALVVVAGTGTVSAESSQKEEPRPKPRVQRPGDVAGYRLPFKPGRDVRVAQGWKDPYSHTGRAKYAYDLSLPMHTPVLAAASGVVSYVRDGQQGCGNTKKFRNRSEYVTIDHPDGSTTLYGHLSTILVKVGDMVEVGQVIARSGRSGYTNCQPHLHFERGLQGHPLGLNQSIPVYFEEYPDRQLREGQTVQATPACTTPNGARPPIGTLCATYRGVSTKSPILFKRLETTIDYDWSEQGPGGYWLDAADQPFSAAWTGQFELTVAGVYTLDVQASDMLRVRIDGVTLVDEWTEVVGPVDASVSRRMTAGKHTIEVWHVNRRGGGMLRVSWTPELIDGAWVRWAKVKPEA